MLVTLNMLTRFYPVCSSQKFVHTIPTTFYMGIPQNCMLNYYHMKIHWPIVQQLSMCAQFKVNQSNVYNRFLYCKNNPVYIISSVLTDKTYTLHID